MADAHTQTDPRTETPRAAPRGLCSPGKYSGNGLILFDLQMQGLRPFANALSAARRQIEWGMSPDGNDSDPTAQRACANGSDGAPLAARAAGFADGVEGAAGGAPWEPIAGARKGRAEATVEEMVLTPSPPQGLRERVHP